MHIVDATGPTPICIPFTLEHLLPELMGVASKWQSLGEALSLDEDHLDEIFTNNETDEACLQVMLEVYLARADLDHSWEEIQAALKKIEDESALNLVEAAPTIVEVITCMYVTSGLWTWVDQSLYPSTYNMYDLQLILIA